MGRSRRRRTEWLFAIAASVASAGARGDAGPAPAVLDGGVIHLSGVTAPLSAAGARGRGRDPGAQARVALAEMTRRAEAAGGRGAALAQLLVFVRRADQVGAVEGALCPRLGRPAPAVAIVVGDPLEPGADVLLSGVALPAGAERVAVSPAGWPARRCGSHALRSGARLFFGGLSAATGAPGAAAASGDVRVQAQGALAAARDVLRAAGMGPADVVAGRVFLARPEDFAPMNEAYRPFFPTDPPARATVVAGTPGAGALFQVVFTAVKHDDRRVIRPGPPPRDAGPPYSPAIRAGDHLFLSGTVGTGPPADVAAQTARSLDALGRTLEAAGLGFSDVVDALVYATSARAAAAIAPVVRARLAGARCAVTTVGVGLVIPEPQVEIMLTAAAPARPPRAAARPAGGPPIIAIGGISHESNSFNPKKTTRADFRIADVTDPDKALAELARANDPTAGFIEGARRFGLSLHPTLLAGATPKGPVTDEAFDALVAELIRRLEAAPRLDGLLLDNHGAMVVESHPHGDAEMLRRLRAALGPDLPIVVVNDFHANVAPEATKHATALLTYKENPHVDTKERGIQAAEIMARVVRRQVKPVQAIVKPPMVYNIVFQKTKRPPLLPIVEESRRLERDNGKILAVSVSGGYQYADVPEMGPSVIVVADGDEALARREARRLADRLWDTRRELVLDLPDPATAVKLAMSSDRFPVALMDMGDNIGGGSAGDATFVLDELLKQKAEGWVVVIADPEAVRAAEVAGIGGPFDMPVGGKTDGLHGKPVRVRGRVKSMSDGRYVEPEIRHGGERHFDMGRVAVIEAEGSTRDLPNLLLVTTKRSSPNSLHQLVSNGVYPSRQKILVAKGAVAPRAAYEPIAARIIEVDSPGATAVNPARFRYKNVRAPLFGLSPTTAKAAR